MSTFPLSFLACFSLNATHCYQNLDDTPGVAQTHFCRHDFLLITSKQYIVQGWKQLDEEDLQLFAACNLPLLDMTYNLAPQAGLNSGSPSMHNAQS